MAPDFRPPPSLQAIQHRLDRGAILAVAFKDFVGFGKAVPVQHQPHQHLLGIRPLVARVAALRRGIAQGFALEIGRGQVVEIQGVVQVEQGLLPFRQFPLDHLAVGMEPVQVAVQRFVVAGGKVRSPNIAQRRTFDPVRHGMFGKREEQAVQRHDFGELAGAVGKSRPRQNLVEPQLPPHLVADMHRARLPGLFHCDLVGIDRQAEVDRRRGLRGRGTDAACPADLLSKSLAGRIRSGKRGLALQAGFEAVGQIQPLLRGCGGQAAKRADDALAGALGGGHRFHQEIVGVRFTLVPFGGLPDIHRTLYMPQYRLKSRKIINSIRHYFAPVRTYCSKQRPCFPKPAKTCRRPWKLG